MAEGTAGDVAVLGGPVGGDTVGRAEGVPMLLLLLLLLFEELSCQGSKWLSI